MEDLYKILGVTKDADDNEIKKAYRKIAQKHHPDKGGNKEDEDIFKKASAAYEVLGDKQRRQQYDQFGSAGGAGGQGFGGFEGFDFNNVNFDFGGGNFGDIFDSFFGGGARQAQRKKGPQRGSDIEIVMSLTFEEAVFGTTKEIELTRNETCEHCKGKGAEPGTNIVTCDECKGTGQQIRIQKTILGQVQTATVCSNCRGAGQIPEKKCSECKGESRVVKSGKVNVKVPAGIHDKATLRLNKKGEAGVQDGPYGDLYVHISVEPSRIFERIGDNIHTKAKIHLLQAVLGDEVEVKTVHGNVTLKIPAGTQSGKIFKIKEKGVQQVGGTRKGDHMVKIDVDIPEKLSKKERELYEELAKQAKLNIKPQSKGLFG